jgi:hypothetical protein
MADATISSSLRLCAPCQYTLPQAVQRPKA